MTNMNHKPKMFPTHFNLVLDASEHAALDTLYEVDPYLDGPEELLHQALRAGIRALNELGEKRRKNPRWMKRTDVEAPKRSEAQHKENTSPSNGRTIFPKPHYHIEDYVAVPLETRLRIKLEDFLAENQGVLSNEESLQMLLDLGLEHAADQKPDHVLDLIKKEYRRRRKLRLDRRA